MEEKRNEKTTIAILEAQVGLLKNQLDNLNSRYKERNNEITRLEMRIKTLKEENEVIRNSQRRLQLSRPEQNFITTMKFLNEKNGKTTSTELLEFLERNNIRPMYFENIKEFFEYYDEDDYTMLSSEYVIFTRQGEIIIIKE